MFLLLINGEVRANINSEKGLRQGDPFCPYLFLFLCIKLILFALQLIERLRFRLSIYVYHLFLQAEIGERMIIKESREKYRKVSGQIVIFCKFKISFDRKVDNVIKKDLTNIFGVKVVECPEMKNILVYHPLLVGKN